MAVDHPDHLKVQGHAFYKEGTKIEKKTVNLFVPKMGKGKVIIDVGGKEAESHSFKTVDVNGRKVFYVVFTDLKGVTGAPKDTAYLMRGTYLRGDNVALYYGDFFSKKMTPKAKVTWDIDADSTDAVAAADDTCSADGTCEDCSCDDCADCDCCKSWDAKDASAAVDPAHKGGGHHHGGGHGHGHHAGHPGHGKGGGHGHRNGGWIYAGGFDFVSKVTK